MTREEASIIIGNIPINSDTMDDCYSITEYQEAKAMAIKALEQEPCEDCISRSSIKQKLQEHHDFFVNAYGGFSNMPLNDKSRVDEISGCIAMVVNEPPVTPQPKTGHWIHELEDWNKWTCSECGYTKRTDIHVRLGYNFCPWCGAKMVEPQERSGKE